MLVDLLHLCRSLRRSPASAAAAVLSLWTVRALGGIVVGTGRFDAASAAIAALVLLAAGGAAVLPAALRAARTDPLIALRSE